MTYTEDEITDILEENDKLKEELFDLKEELDEVKEQLEEERDEHEITKTEKDEYEEHVQCLRMKLSYRKIEIRKLYKQIKQMKKEIKEIEKTDKQFKEQLKEDVKTDNKAVAIINLLDNQFYRVKRNNEYLKSLLSTERQTKIFYRKICKNFFIDNLNELVSNNEEFEDDGELLYKKFELDSEYLDLEEITKEQHILLMKILEEVNETMTREYKETSTIKYIDDNEFRIDNKAWNMNY